MIKALKNSGIEGTNLNIVRVVYDKSIADIIQLGWNIESISTEIKKKTSVPFLHSYSTHYLKSYQEQEHKRKKYKETLKKKPSILICRCYNSRHKTHKYSIRKLLSLIDTLRKVVRPKINRYKYTMTKQTEEEREEMITFAIT